MAITSIATLRTALGIGTLYSDSILTEVVNAADNVLLPFLWKNENYNVGHSNTTTEGTLYFEEVVTDTYYVGQSVVITKNGTPFNGTKTLTGVGENTITFAVTGSPTATEYHPVVPYGVVSGVTQNTYTTIPAIREASLMICVSIWTSRQTNSGNGMMPDGSMGNMYAMSSQLIARVRGLIAPYLAPNSMVG